VYVTCRCRSTGIAVPVRCLFKGTGTGALAAPIKRCMGELLTSPMKYHSDYPSCSLFEPQQEFRIKRAADRKIGVWNVNSREGERDELQVSPSQFLYG
jgi:hypothetical protein